MTENITSQISLMLEDINEAPRKKLQTLCCSLNTILFGTWELTPTLEQTKRNKIYTALIDYCIFIEDVKRRKEKVSEVTGESEEKDKSRKRTVDS